MIKMFKLIMFLIIVIILLSFLGKKDDETINMEELDLQIFNFNYSDYEPQVQGKRLLGIDINEGNIDYGTSFKIAKDMGMNFTTLSIPWDDIESKKGEYFNQFLSIANSYYPSEDTKIGLVVSPIDTSVNRIPEYLKGKKINDPEVIDSFKNMLDYVFLEIKDLDLLSISIGNEVDIFLWEDKEKWNEFEDFFAEIYSYIKEKQPKLKVGTKMTFDGLVNKNRLEAKKINQISDVVMVTYYPLTPEFEVKNVDEISNDFDEIMNLYNKNFQILESGFPSGKLVKSSQSNQAEFIHKMFLSWDEYASRIEAINITWFNECSKSELSGYAKYYGTDDKRFVDFLGTLGHYDSKGKEKQSINILKNELKFRNWK